MKIHIIDDLNKSIDGYKAILFNNIEEEFAKLSNNSCEFILANDIFDYVESKEIPAIIQTLLLKLRLNGKMSIGGKDIHLFCKSVKNELISEHDASNIISKTKSLVSHSFVQDIVKQLGLKYTTQLSGVHYEITAYRQ